MCSVFGCDKAEFRRGMCSMHYSRMMRHGVLSVGNGRGLSSMELFWRNVSFWSPEHAGCFEWTAKRNEDGYGMTTVNGHTLAHRASWELHRGEIPDGLNILHSCDNPACVNPDHLFLGTQNDNVQDMIRKGRKAYDASPKGERHGMAKLSAAQVASIRQDTRYQRDIATEYGVSRAHVGRIKSGSNWSGQ